MIDPSGEQKIHVGLLDVVMGLESERASASNPAENDAVARYGVTIPSAGHYRVWVRYGEDPHSIVGLGGAGVRQSLSRHAGLRFDVRAHAYKNSTVSIVDVAPARFAGSASTSSIPRMRTVPKFPKS